MLSTTERLKQARIVAIFRGNYMDRWMVYAEHLYAGGITALELTLNSPGALDGIRQIKAHMGAKVLVGAGTVLTADQANSAIDAGAEFIVSPDTDEAVVSVCIKRTIPALPGAYTPTEIKRAYQLGAAIVKVFPAPNPAYIRNVLAPLDFIPVMATGGISAENMAEYFDAGVALIGVGNALAKPGLNADTIEARAKAFGLAFHA